MFTKKDYLYGKCSHREYYAQMVEATNAKDMVVSYWGLEKLQKAYNEDQCLNTLPIKEWDILAERLVIGPFLTFRDLGDMNTLSNRVCVLKEAARQVVNEKM
jgi:hypothetical protein